MLVKPKISRYRTVDKQYSPPLPYNNINYISCFFLSVSFYDFVLFFFVFHSEYISLSHFSAYVCHVTTAGSLGDQLKCDNQSINLSINESYLSIKTCLGVVNMVSYWPQSTSEDDDIRAGPADSPRRHELLVHRVNQRVRC